MWVYIANVHISKNKWHQDRTVWEKLEDFVRSQSHSWCAPTFYQYIVCLKNQLSIFTNLDSLEFMSNVGTLIKISRALWLTLFILGVCVCIIVNVKLGLCFHEFWWTSRFSIHSSWYRGCILQEHRMKCYVLSHTAISLMGNWRWTMQFYVFYGVYSFNSHKCGLLRRF